MNEEWDDEAKRLADELRNAALNLLLHLDMGPPLLVELAGAEAPEQPVWVAIGNARGIRTLLLDK